MTQTYFTLTLIQNIYSLNSELNKTNEWFIAIKKAKYNFFHKSNEKDNITLALLRKLEINRKLYQEQFQSSF